MKDSLRPFGMIAGDKVCCLVVGDRVVVEIFSMYCSVGLGVGANVVEVMVDFVVIVVGT